MNTETMIQRYLAGASLSTIADEAGTTRYKVRRRLVDAGAEIRPGGRTALNSRLSDTELVAKYDSGLSTHQIAELAGISRDAVLYRLRRTGASIRTIADGIRARKNKHVTITAELKAVIDGLMLGDGAITKVRGEGKLVVGQKSANVEWLRLLRTTLDSLDVECIKMSYRQAATRQIQGRAIHASDGYTLITRAYVEFSAERERWYPQGTKRVPPDVDVSPMSLAQWYWGDGSLLKRGGVVLCTDGFALEDVEYLMSLLVREYGWRPRIQRTNIGRPRITLNRESEGLAFRRLVAPYCPDCFKYKLGDVSE